MATTDTPAPAAGPERTVSVDMDEFRALAAEVTRIGKIAAILVMRVEETLAAAFPHVSPAARPAPACRSRRRGGRPDYLRPVKGGES